MSYSKSDLLQDAIEASVEELPPDLEYWLPVFRYADSSVWTNGVMHKSKDSAIASLLDSRLYEEVKLVKMVLPNRFKNNR